MITRSVRMTRARQMSAVLAALLAMAACSSDDDPVDSATPAPAPAPVGGGSPSGGGSPVGGASPVDCDGLVRLTIDAASIGLPTGGATVTSSETVAAAGSAAAAVGEYCKVVGAIRPVDSAAPPIRFQVNLPTDWNSKAVMFGGGGYNGTIAAGTGNVPAGPTDQPTPLGRGYATFGSDSGHAAGPAGSRDGSFGTNAEALANFSGDAIKKTRDVAGRIIAARYGSAATRVYFAGGSTGGREALLAVQNWPADFDGAIVLYPAWNAVALDLQFGRVTRQLAQPGAYPNRAKRKLIFDAAVAACDGLDAAFDGIIANDNACRASFDPVTETLDGAPLRCADGADTGDTCLSDAQLASFITMDSPLTLPYSLASDQTGYPGFTTWGTDFGIPGDQPLQPTVLTLALGTEQPAFPFPPVTATSMPPYGSTFWDQWVKYFVTGDGNFNSLTLDPENPGPWQNRIVELSALQEATSTDLTAFKDRGGRILMAHGVHDALVSNRATRDYLDRLQSTMGADSVAGFLRYYEIPGYGHAVSTVFNAAWDSLTALENWVEQGVEPPPQIVADSVGVPGRTRPLCRYPEWPKYSGAGDINVAGSYECALQ